MARTKTKRVVWTMAVLLALSFVAAMVLHKHEEPIIIGNLSKEDVSEISHASLQYARLRVKFFLKRSFKAHDIKGLARYTREYVFTKVVSIRVLESGTNMVLIGTAKDKIFLETQCIKCPHGWDFSDWNSRSGLQFFKPAIPR